MISGKSKKQETDPVFMKSITFKFSDYIGKFIQKAKNMLQRRRLASLNQQQFYYEQGKNLLYKELSVNNML